MRVSEIEIGQEYRIKEYNKRIAARTTRGCGFPAFWSYWIARVIGRDGRKFVIEWEEQVALHDIKMAISLVFTNIPMVWATKKRTVSVTPGQIVEKV